MGHVPLLYIRQQVAYTSPFKFNENPFPVTVGKYLWNIFYTVLILTLTPLPTAHQNIKPVIFTVCYCN